VKAVPPNYGVSSVMMVSGNQWFDVSLRDGEVESGLVKGHTGADTPPVPEPEARASAARADPFRRLRNRGGCDTGLGQSTRRSLTMESPSERPDASNGILSRPER
jgi:hypothetical protein